MKHIVIIEGHPDGSEERFNRALADAYATGAESAGHAVTRIRVGALDFPVLRTRADWEDGAPPPDIAKTQDAIGTADHMVFLYPLWLGALPALLKAFLEQVFRPGFTISAVSGEGPPKKLLKGKSARIVVTMGMPALAYRWFYGAHSLKSLERNILKFSGVGPVRESVIGMVETKNVHTRTRWLARMFDLGRRGQ